LVFPGIGKVHADFPEPWKKAAVFFRGLEKAATIIGP
jgi:hypothetical protein